ncbi:hypothetical protein CIN_11910 [Commensalibacter intestini A911]|uniref:Aspartate racemase n=1 Tax=Commensalibacter intestini A911 TaxID=1088868 RepID=G6F138_9PROT|nr:hypothetical protein CIN_11910 [Commensalibacter intestini A911]
MRLNCCNVKESGMRAGLYLANAAQKVEAGGADFLVICTNTMHKVAD